MAQHLPDDVWREIVETPCLDPEDLPNMSLASRRMHRLVVPALFRYVEFRFELHTEFEHHMATLIRANMRARFLFNSPELLRHTRVFSSWGIFYAVDSIAEYLALQEDSDSSTSGDDAENFLAVTQDARFFV